MSSVYRLTTKSAAIYGLAGAGRRHLSIVLIDAARHVSGRDQRFARGLPRSGYHEELLIPGVFDYTTPNGDDFFPLFAGAIALTINKSTGLIRYAGSASPSALQSRTAL
jgi:hypothetical protein